MAYFPDLAHETMIASGPHVRAIGWLSYRHAFESGPTSPEFRSKLRALCNRWLEGLVPLGWPAVAGPHKCELCGKAMAAGNVGVPHGDVLYAAPEMVCHYVDAHEYLPPQVFVEAVLASPLQGSAEYEAAVRQFVWSPPQ